MICKAGEIFVICKPVFWWGLVVLVIGLVVIYLISRRSGKPNSAIIQVNEKDKDVSVPSHPVMIREYREETVKQNPEKPIVERDITQDDLPVYGETTTDQEEDEEPSFEIGQKILYDTQGDLQCNLVIAMVDEEEWEINGFFVVDLPIGAKATPPHHDRDEDEVILKITYPDGNAEEVVFDVRKPDELDDWDVTIGRTITKFQSAKPV